eukprot:TRINITY_DN9918_c0_g1_i1.p1 TRINITY_DN9918_c0_g1~~TRINITY_DN9918_c0_g1_i1.p1  ORF type:complete len:333 (+),score=84.01 TRINITY_DN9918_c0_g1_i1:287-1285(+)
MKKAKVELTNVVRVRVDSKRKFRINFESKKKKKNSNNKRANESTELKIEPWIPFRRSEFHSLKENAKTTTGDATVNDDISFVGIQKVGCLANEVKIALYDGSSLVIQFVGSEDGRLRTGYSLTVTRGRNQIVLHIETHLNQSSFGLCKEITVGSSDGLEFRWKELKHFDYERTPHPQTTKEQLQTTLTPQLSSTSQSSLPQQQPKRNPQQLSPPPPQLTKIHTLEAPQAVQLLDPELSIAPSFPSMLDIGGLSYCYPDEGEDYFQTNCTSPPVLYIEQCYVDPIFEEEKKLFSIGEDGAEAPVNINNKFEANDWYCNVDVNGDEESSHFETL